MHHPIVAVAIQSSASEFHVEHEELLGRSRKRPIVYARQTACWVLRRRTPMSFPAIARVFDQDHTTVMNAVRCVERAKDPWLRDGSRRVLHVVDERHPRPHRAVTVMMGDMPTAEELHARIDNDFGYHPPTTPEIAAAHERVREVLANAAHEIIDIIPDSRETSLFLTSMEVAMYHANAIIARGQALR